MSLYSECPSSFHGFFFLPTPFGYRLGQFPIYISFIDLGRNNGYGYSRPLHNCFVSPTIPINLYTGEACYNNRSKTRFMYAMRGDRGSTSYRNGQQKYINTLEKKPCKTFVGKNVTCTYVRQMKWKTRDKTCLQEKLKNCLKHCSTTSVAHKKSI